MKITNNKWDILEMLQRYGQQHIINFWDDLTEGERCQLIDDIQNIDFETFLCDVQTAKERSASRKMRKVDDIMKPPSQEICGSLAKSSLQDIEKYNELGLRSIAKGECCVILMAGGAGTRLGVDYPKGMYNVGLPSKKSLFQIQAERIIRLQYLASQRFDEVTPIMWYIMTSDCTRDATIDYFAKNQYFGLSNEQVVFFEQLTLPVIGLDGKILLESKYRISKSPDGNGGLYRALRNYKIIDDMKQRGIKYIHVYGVDNILIKVADPVFFGFFIEKEAECAPKVVEKKSPKENVGVVAKIDEQYQIVEYSEIDKETTELVDVDDNSKLMYRCGSICSHLFHINFLERVCHIDSSNILVQHIALKAVPYINTVTGNLEKPNKINAIKMETFVFDIFPLAKSFVIWEADRNYEFSPLKNSNESKFECPNTSKMSVLNYHNKIIRDAIRDPITKDKAASLTVEISPLVSYSGEGLGCIDQYIEDAEEGSVLVFELNEHDKVIVKRIEDYSS